MGVGYLTGQGGGVSNVKSIQRGVATDTITSIDVTISAVDLNKSIVIINTVATWTDAPYYAYVLYGGRLTTPTNLNILAGVPGAKTVYWTVVEFNNVKSLQAGTATTTATTNVDVTINNVDVSKSMIFVSHTSSNSSIQYKPMAEELIAPTTLRLMTYDNVIRTSYWQVIEFK